MAVLLATLTLNASHNNIQLSFGSRVPTFYGKSCQLCLQSANFVAALLYLSVFPFGGWGLDVDLIVSVPEFSYLLWLTYEQICVLYTLGNLS